jgi:hypothetical protein
MELGCLQVGSIIINSSFITLNVNQKWSISMDEIVSFPAGYYVELLTDTMVTFNQATLVKVTKQILNEKIGTVQKTDIEQYGSIIYLRKDQEMYFDTGTIIYFVYNVNVRFLDTSDIVEISETSRVQDHLSEASLRFYRKGDRLIKSNSRLAFLDKTQ